MTTKGHRNAKDVGCFFFDVGTSSDARLYSGQSKGQSIVLAFSTPWGLIYPQLGHGNVIVTEMIWLDWAQYDGRSIYPRWSFLWDSEWLDLSTIASMSGTFPSGWKETFLLFFSLQRMLSLMQQGKVIRLSAWRRIRSVMRLFFLNSVCCMLGKIRSLIFTHFQAFQVLRVVSSPHPHL